MRLFKMLGNFYAKKLNIYYYAEQPPRWLVIQPKLKERIERAEKTTKFSTNHNRVFEKKF